MIFMKMAVVEVDLKSELMVKDIFANYLFIFYIFLDFPNLQANCIDSTAAPEAVFAAEVKKMSAENMKPQEQLTLEPYERDHAVVVGVYRYLTVWRFCIGHSCTFFFLMQIAQLLSVSLLRPPPKQKK